MNKETILSWLKTTDVPLTVISTKTGVSRKTLYNWINGSEMRRTNIDKIIDVYNTEIKLTVSGVEVKGDAKMNENIVQLEASKEFEQKNKLINYQEQEIKELREENKFLKDNPIPKEHFDKLTFDWKTTVDIRFNFTKVTRRIYDLTNIENLAKALETDKQTIEKYFDSKKTYEMNEHPVNQIISKQSLDHLQKETGFFTSMLKKGFSLSALFSGMGYITLLVNYELNDKTCKTITYCQARDIQPLKGKMKIVNKIQFLSE